VVGGGGNEELVVDDDGLYENAVDRPNPSTRGWFFAECVESHKQIGRDGEKIVVVPAAAVVAVGFDDDSDCCGCVGGCDNDSNCSNVWSVRPHDAPSRPVSFWIGQLTTKPQTLCVFTMSERRCLTSDGTCPVFFILHSEWTWWSGNDSTW